jgi:hypothetical protein
MRDNSIHTRTSVVVSAKTEAQQLIIELRLRLERTGRLKRRQKAQYGCCFKYNDILNTHGALAIQNDTFSIKA